MRPLNICFLPFLALTLITIVPPRTVHAQSLCVDGRQQLSAPLPALGCGPFKDKYYIRHGAEIFGFSESRERSPGPRLPRSLTVAAGASAAILNGETYFAAMSIGRNGSLSVPSGTVLRVREGSCTIAGSIIVDGAAKGGERPGQLAAFDEDRALAPAHPGISNRAAGFGAVAQSVSTIAGGKGGYGLDQTQAMQLRYPGPQGGGAGAAGATEIGGAGGGTFVLLCEGRVRIDGSIFADGVPAFVGGAGGGAGGVLVIASDTEIILGATGVLEAKGGDGGPAASNTGPGGGGGGGIIHLIAPRVTRLGTTNVSGGTGYAAASGTLQNVIRSGGGGGGACGGDGGDGGDINSDLSHGASGSGAPGHFIITETSPRYIFG